MIKTAAQAMTRFGLGAGANDATPEALRAQLQGPDPGLASGQFSALPSGLQAVDILEADKKRAHANLTAAPDQQKQFKSLQNAAYLADANAQLGFAASTKSGFRERLVWFWANHFSTTAVGGLGMFTGAMLREAIRPYVNGRFTDMVLAVERHPAMLRFLANADSIGPDSIAGLAKHRGLNENLGRECMELHTVGLTAGYTQTDVTNMAKILTGWGLAGSDQGGDATGFLYRPTWHEPGPQTVLGRQFDGGEQAGIDALTYLSTYPATYKHIATQLVTHFVADTPPPRAVAHIAGVMRESGGDLGVTSAALVDLPEAWVPGQKLKSPFDYVISVVRTLPPPPDQPAPDLFNAMHALGQPVWLAPLPNGWPDQASYWSASDMIMAKLNFAYNYAGRFHDGEDAPRPVDIASEALGRLLRPATYQAMQNAGSRREALTLFLTSPEFMRR